MCDGSALRSRVLELVVEVEWMRWAGPECRVEGVQDTEPSDEAKEPREEATLLKIQSNTVTPGLVAYIQTNTTSIHLLTFACAFDF